MASAQPPNPSDIYSQAQQVKHYKKQASASHPQPTFTRAPSFSSFVIPSGYLGGHIIQRPSVDGNENPMYHQSSRRRHVVLEVGGLKQDLKDKLHAIVFDEELKARESLCSLVVDNAKLVTPPPPPPPPQSSATVLLPAATPEHLEA
ncbi:hypothetical protein AgCh_032663 [Apium graveolens]